MVAACAAAAAALAAIAIGMARAPYGDWDAWAIYNFRARSIYRGGYEWRDGLSRLLYRNHPDYPLLLPLSVVRSWIYAGGESMAAPRLIGGVFMLATTGLVPSAIAALRGRAQACIAGVVLLGNVFMLRHASSQYADVPLMFFFAAAVSLIALHDELAHERGPEHWSSQVSAAGLAAWTKNEGLLFLAALTVAHFAVVGRTRGLRAYAGQLRPLAAGILPVLAILIFFKSTLAPPSDLVSLAAKQSVLAKLLDPGPLFRDCGRAVTAGSAARGLPDQRGLCAADLRICVGLGGQADRGRRAGGADTPVALRPGTSLCT